MVRVIVHGHLAEFFPGGKDQHSVPIPESMSVSDLVEKLGVNPKLIMRVFVNGKPARKEDLVGDGDEVLLMSPASGG